MSDRYFVDSNVFLYASETDALAKSGKAAAWLRHLLDLGTGFTSLQVLNEVANVLLKRGKLDTESVFAVVDGFSVFGAAPLNRETVVAARVIRMETSYEWWDCILLASAMELGCRRFLSEDLRHGQSVRGLTIVSPFLHSPPDTPVH